MVFRRIADRRLANLPNLWLVDLLRLEVNPKTAFLLEVFAPWVKRVDDWRATFCRWQFVPAV